MQQENVGEVGGDPQYPHGHIASKQLVCVRRRRDHDGQEQRQQAFRRPERDHAVVGMIDADRQLRHASGGLGAAAADAHSQALNEPFHEAGEDDGRQHQQPEESENREAGLEKVIEGDAQHETVLRE